MLRVELSLEVVSDVVGRLNAACYCCSVCYCCPIDDPDDNASFFYNNNKLMIPYYKHNIGLVQQ
jgi:hypothetical protein